MLNAEMVNARPHIFCPQHFCEFFPAFAMNPRFKNPFKYNRRFLINQPQAAKLANNIERYQ
jgi:hypothetical protein